MDHHIIEASTNHPMAEAAAADNTQNRNVKVAAGYVLQERLGAGSFATVYKGVRLAEYQQAINTASTPPTDSIAAIKAISRQSKKLTKKVLENLDMEIAILRTYRHPNIVCLHEVQKTDRHFYLVLEYCGGGDLQRLIRTRQKGRLSERLCRRLVRDLAAGLGFLWGKELVHRDIKPQNLLLTGPLPAEDEVDNPPREDAKRALMGMTGDRFQLKIADFGFARHLSGVDLAETMCGSPLYMAPEILVSFIICSYALNHSFQLCNICMLNRVALYSPLVQSGERYDAKADLWSVGAVLFEMIAGKTPFHGENHLDLLRNIKTKAVRLPANVRISKEFVHLLKLLLDRKPHNRAGFDAFFEASEALVALGCNGTPTVAPTTNIQKSTDATDDESMPFHPLGSGQKIVDRDALSTQMNLCAISENEGGGESFHQGAGSLATVATLGTVNHQQLQQQVRQQQSTGANYISNISATQTNAIVQGRPSDHIMNKPGVVTPPFNPVAAPIPPPALPSGLQGVVRQHGSRPSVFAPLQGSPNLSPSTSPGGCHTNPPIFSLGNAPHGVNAALPSAGTLPAPRPGPIPTVQQQHYQQQRMIGRPTQVNNNLVSNRRNSSPRTSSHGSQSSDSGFVLVEYSGSRSRPSSGQNSPSTSMGGIAHSPTVSPHNSTGRVTILDARNNMGILGTSPGTGRALVGKMMMGGSPAKSSYSTPPTASGVGRFDMSPRAALSRGGCLAHIEALARILAASEDITRRAITVAHLGDMRAYLAMELLIKLKEESQLSSMSTGTPMEGVDDDRNSGDTQTVGSNSKRLLSNKAVKEEDEEEEDELPFAMTTSSSDGGSGENMPESNIVKSSDEKPKGEVTSSMIQLHFREALTCYFKTLTMIKGSICAAQKVMKDVQEVANIPPPPIGNTSSNSQNPYTPLKDRCSASLEWLGSQYHAVVERADAASEQISKLQKANSSQTTAEEIEDSICVEELIYNHSLKCGREGAIKQIVGNYGAARSCFRSAGLLAETLLMNSKVRDEDQAVLEGYVHSFAEQIITLDGLIRVEMKKSRASMHNNQDGSVSPSVRRQSSDVTPVLTSL